MSSETRKKACICVVAHVKTRCRDERRRTHQLDTPPQQRRLAIFVVRQLLTFQNLHRINDAQATVEFATWDVEVEVLHAHRVDSDRRHRHQPMPVSPSTTTTPNEREVWTNPTKPLDSLGRHILLLEMTHQLISQRLKHTLEFSTLLRLAIGRHHRRVVFLFAMGVGVMREATRVTGWRAHNP